MTAQIDPAIAALAELERRREAAYFALKAYEAAIGSDDFREAERIFGEANSAAFLARDAALKSVPTTPAGAVALLRLAGPAVVEIGHDPDHAPTLVNAIGAAVAILEQGVQQ